MPSRNRSLNSLLLIRHLIHNGNRQGSPSQTFPSSRSHLLPRNSAAAAAPHSYQKPSSAPSAAIRSNSIRQANQQPNRAVPHGTALLLGRKSGEAAGCDKGIVPLSHWLKKRVQTEVRTRKCRCPKAYLRIKPPRSSMASQKAPAKRGSLAAMRALVAIQPDGVPVS